MSKRVKIGRPQKAKSRSHKTAKRLAAKRVMLAAKKKRR